MPNQQEVFEAAHAHVAKWEGGYFDHPNDPGGRHHVRRQPHVPEGA